MDYTFYWFLSIYDYYMYSGDKDFVTQLYPRMQSMMDYVLGRTNANGMVEGMTGDWVFVDWADGYLDKKGELSFEQVLFCKSLETMALCAGLAGNTADKTKYEKLASALRSKLEPAFWNEQKQAMVHNRVQGKQSESVTRYANMFSVFFQHTAPIGFHFFHHRFLFAQGAQCFQFIETHIRSGDFQNTVILQYGVFDGLLFIGIQIIEEDREHIGAVC